MPERLISAIIRDTTAVLFFVMENGDLPLYRNITIKKPRLDGGGPVEPWLAGDIYFSNGFHGVFDELSAEADPDGLYPTITVRKIMWKLRMKPLRREYWEEEI